MLSPRTVRRRSAKTLCPPQIDPVTGVTYSSEELRPVFHAMLVDVVTVPDGRLNGHDELTRYFDFGFADLELMYQAVSPDSSEPLSPLTSRSMRQLSSDKSSSDKPDCVSRVRSENRRRPSWRNWVNHQRERDSS